jgi:hypothetical protein
MRIMSSWMEAHYNDRGDFVIKVDEETRVRKVKGQGLVFAQRIDEDEPTERVYLSVDELREILRLIDEEASK